jgi:hypothetical protein
MLTDCYERRATGRHQAAQCLREHTRNPCKWSTTANRTLRAVRAMTSVRQMIGGRAVGRRPRGTGDPPASPWMELQMLATPANGDSTRTRPSSSRRAVSSTAPDCPSGSPSSTLRASRQPSFPGQQRTHVGERLLRRLPGVLRPRLLPRRLIDRGSSLRRARLAPTVPPRADRRRDTRPPRRLGPSIWACGIDPLEGHAFGCAAP